MLRGGSFIGDLRKQLHGLVGMVGTGDRERGENWV